MEKKRRAAGAARLGKAIRELERVRGPLFVELRELLEDPDYLRGEPAHASCTRPRNQMRISPLEAEAIAEALRDRPELERKLPGILRRLRSELPRLRDSTRRQSFSCPLLENGLCLVHHTAKPIGCLAWHPGRELSDVAWFAFARRDALNDVLHGQSWKLRAIPLWLARVLGEPLPERGGRGQEARAAPAGRRPGSRRPARPQPAGRRPPSAKAASRRMPPPSPGG